MLQGFAFRIFVPVQCLVGYPVLAKWRCAVQYCQLTGKIFTVPLVLRKSERPVSAFSQTLKFLAWTFGYLTSLT